MTKKCIESILKISNKLKIMVLDNNSIDGSFANLKESYQENYQVEIFETGSNLGYAKGNNFGFKLISKNYKNVKYVVVMNPDIEVSDCKVFKKLYSFLKKNEDYSIATCEQIFNKSWNGIDNVGWKLPTKINLFFAGTLIGKIFNFETNEHYENLALIDGQYAVEVDVVSGCFFMANLEDLINAGLFDDRTFLYYEENILAKKLKDMGKKEAVILDEFFYHNHQEKDKKLTNYNKKIVDRRFLLNSKMVYVENYSGMTGVQLRLCKFTNNLDYQLKKIIYSILAIPKIKK